MVCGKFPVGASSRGSKGARFVFRVCVSKLSVQFRLGNWRMEMREEREAHLRSWRDIWRRFGERNSSINWDWKQICVKYLILKVY